MIGEFKQIVEREMRGVMHDAVLAGKNFVVSFTPVGVTAHLKQGIAGIVLSPFMGKIGTQGPAMRHDYYAEHGRAAGRMPPHQPIELWVRRKIRPHVLAVDRTTRKVTKRLGKSAAERKIQAVTYLIRRAIGEHGTEGAHMFEKGEAKLTPLFAKLIDQAIARIEREGSDKP